MKGSSVSMVVPSPGRPTSPEVVLRVKAHLWTYSRTGDTSRWRASWEGAVREDGALEDHLCVLPPEDNLQGQFAGLRDPPDHQHLLHVVTAEVRAWDNTLTSP